MACSSGNSKSSGSGSDEDLRKRKRMESNRESARRSRMRKLKHLDDLMAQLTLLRKDNNQILTSINFIDYHYANIEAENSVLRAQIVELSQRLDSLNEKLNYHNNSIISNGNGVSKTEAFGICGDNFISPFNLPYLNQPIMASADMFQY